MRLASLLRIVPAVPRLALTANLIWFGLGVFLFVATLTLAHRPSTPEHSCPPRAEIS